MRRVITVVGVAAAAAWAATLAPRALRAYRSTMTLHKMEISTVLSPSSGEASSQVL
ncbi:hypothetical protein AB0L44_46055 [Nonomuraea wenchangensis]|uniref:hypothetical protein n=1 Tax=Nonomuraea wenchangensis TaxID=568860 RepID=UPI00342DC8CC